MWRAGCLARRSSWGRDTGSLARTVRPVSLTRQLATRACAAGSRTHLAGMSALGEHACRQVSTKHGVFHGLTWRRRRLGRRRAGQQGRRRAQLWRQASPDAAVRDLCERVRLRAHCRRHRLVLPLVSASCIRPLLLMNSYHTSRQALASSTLHRAMAHLCGLASLKSRTSPRDLPCMQRSCRVTIPTLHGRGTPSTHMVAYCLLQRLVPYNTSFKRAVAK